MQLCNFVLNNPYCVVRHSAGCLVAVNTYFEAPEKVAALILVAPAIAAPFILKKEEKKDEDVTNGSTRVNPFVRIWMGVCKLCMFVAGPLFRLFRGVRETVRLIFVKALTMVLRSSLAMMVVRFVMDKFGILGIQNAWYDASQITDHVLQGYTKPLRAKGWEKALLEFTIAMITDSTSYSAKRLAEITCPVLIVTGDTDRLVPSWNAERLSQVIPGSTFKLIKNCGHLPHEERVDEFLTIVERFLQRVLHDRGERFSQGGEAAAAT